MSNSVAGLQCDYLVTPGWYRFVDDDYNFLAWQPVGLNTCGTNSGLFTNYHPTRPGDVAITGVRSSNAYLQAFTTVEIKHCGAFYIYHLSPPGRLSQCYPTRYCTTNAPPVGFTVQPYGYSAFQSPSPSASVTPTSSASGTYDGWLSDPCFNNTVLTDPSRKVSTRVWGHASDELLLPGWYRFADDDAFTFLASVGTSQWNRVCYTDFAMLVAGPHPTRAGQLTTLLVVAADMSGTIRLTKAIVVKHCGDFFVYGLSRISDASSNARFRYCTTNSTPAGFTSQPYVWSPGTPMGTLSAPPPLPPSYSPTPATMTPTPSQSSTYRQIADPCSNYTLIDDNTRLATNWVGGHACDNSLAAGWYRLGRDSPAYLPQAELLWHTCYTQAPVFVSGAYPTTSGQITVATLNVSSLARGTDSYLAGLARNLPLPTVAIQHCGSYLVYQLQPLDGGALCLRYCTISDAPAGFVPAAYPRTLPSPSPTPSYGNASIDPCYSYIPLSDPTRRETYAVVGSSTDAILPPQWYRLVDDEFVYLSQSAPPRYYCGTVDPAFVGANHPNASGQVVSVPVHESPDDGDDADPYGGGATVSIKHCGSYFGKYTRLYFCNVALSMWL